VSGVARHDKWEITEQGRRYDDEGAGGVWNVAANRSRGHTPNVVIERGLRLHATRHSPNLPHVNPDASPVRPAPMVSPDLAAPALAPALLRLHATLSQRDFWPAVRTLAREALTSDSVTLEIAHDAEGVPRTILREGHPYTPRERRREHPARAWLAEHVGALAYRLTDVAPPRELRRSPFYKRVMRREGWDNLLCVVAWRAQQVVGTLNFHRAAGQPDFTLRELRVAEALQPHFQIALNRMLAHEEAVFLGRQFADLLENVPVGLLLLDWELRPLWINGEAAQACAVWNHGERRAAALSPRRAFRVPDALAKACMEQRAQWESTNSEARESATRPRVLSEDAIGVHAQLALHAVQKGSLLRPVFHIQLDYRRPRGDRNRPLSPGAVALLARLTTREREVAIRVREGLSTEEIAIELRRSFHTIKTQLTSIFQKLGVHSRTKVAALLNR
jgi:DNA-binding CsgD family transcriptional regulator/PAS domain-containing protein